MISKGLLSEVLGYEVFQIHDYDKKYPLSFNYRMRSGKDWTNSTINIHELAFMCKEWAFDKGYSIDSYRLKGMLKPRYKCGILLPDKWHMLKECDTEPEAIFKACEWILKEGNES